MPLHGHFIYFSRFYFTGPKKSLLNGFFSALFLGKSYTIEVKL
jgi:hypothetical protein